jgi:hypothetical protein
MEAFEASRYLAAKAKNASLGDSGLSGAPASRRALKQWAYRHLPFRPLFKFLWSYGLKGGFLDGAVGFRYCLLQSLYEYQVSLKILELQSDRVVAARFDASFYLDAAGQSCHDRSLHTERA